MTTNSPRIYVYKITFIEVDYYYFGSHKEKRFDEYYMGSPVTHKECWKLYTPRKEYIKFFDFSDVGYIEARILENSLIRPVYKTDPLCLNENCGGIMSPQVCRLGGQKGGKSAFERGVGVHGLSKQQLSENGKKYGKLYGKLGGQKTYEFGLGIHARTKEEICAQSKINGKRNYELGIGVHARSKEQMIKDGQKGGKSTFERGVGVHGLSKQQLSENGKKGANAQHSQRWKCTITGFVSTPTGLSHYQRKRGLDLSNRIRIQ